MNNKWGLLAIMIFSLTVLSGCATTGRNYQSDIDALNARVSSLDGQLSAKDQEIARMREQMTRQESELRDQQAALSRSETEKDSLSRQLESAMESKRRREKAAAASANSDLK